MFFSSIFALALVPMISGLFPRFTFLKGESPASAKFSFNPFKHFAPKVYYYQVQTPSTTAAPKTPREICTMVHNGCYINGNCYKHFGIEVTQAVAIENCRSTTATEGCKGELWIPNLDDLDLYDKIVECNRGDFFASADSQVWLNLESCVNTGPPVVDFTGNHLCETFIGGGAAAAGGGAVAAGFDCTVLKWDKGSFYVEDVACAGPLEYVCKCPITT